MQQHAATFIAETEAATGDDLPHFVKDESDAVLECGILAHGFLRLRCGDCGHDKLVASALQLQAARGGADHSQRLLQNRASHGLCAGSQVEAGPDR